MNKLSVLLIILTLSACTLVSYDDFQERTFSMKSGGVIYTVWRERADATIARYEVCILNTNDFAVGIRSESMISSGPRKAAMQTNWFKTIATGEEFCRKGHSHINLRIRLEQGLAIYKEGNLIGYINTRQLNTSYID